MRLLIGAFALALGLGLDATEAPAQGDPDHLQCFKVTNENLKGLKAVVDVNVGSAQDCKLTKAELYCVPATKTVRSGTLFDGKQPLTPTPYVGPPAETARVCYGVVCKFPNGTAPDQTVTDQFGTHEFTRLRTDMVCAPATDPGPPPTGFQIVTPEIEIQPNQEVTYCYYFRTPNAPTMGIRRWASEMGPAAHRVIMFTTRNTSGQPVDKQQPGTVSASNCGFGSTNPISTWMYAASMPVAEMELPSDDGAGKPVAMEIPPNTAGFLMMHFFNPTNDLVKTTITLTAEALEQGVPYTKTATYVTYNANINIPPQTNNDVESFSCAVPPGLQFWRMSTHTHKQAIRAAVLDSLEVIVESLDWLNPTVREELTPPFFEFSSNQLTYACTYNNPTNRTITSGDSEAVDEQCMAIGYFFPATRPLFCINSTLVPF